MAQMTYGEMENLLTFLASVDTLHITNSQEKMKAKVESWLGVMDDCDFTPSMAAARVYYRDPNAKSITPAILRTLARKAQALQKRATTNPSIPESQPVVGKPAWFDEAVKACDDARAQARDAGAVLTDEDFAAIVQEVRNKYGSKPSKVRANDPARACKTENCHCPHTECIGGFLEKETARQGKNGTYVAVEKCPICAEAVAMKGQF